MNNAQLIKELRSLTQAGMKDCRDALEETNWDLQKAVDVIKTKGLNIVSSREGKIASEGLVAIASSDNHNMFMVEVNCQTDFTANSKAFKDLVNSASLTLMNKTLKNEVFTAASVDNVRVPLVASTKENMVVRRWWAEQTLHPNARVFAYTHSNGKIGVLLTLLAPSKEALTDPAFVEFGNDVCMQIAAMNPSAVSSDCLDAAEVARTKNLFLKTQLTELKKPQATWAKILEGKFNKWYTEVCLLEQESIITPKTAVKQVLKNLNTKLGAEVTVVNFVRCQVGEGIEKATKNFADEVQKLSGL